MGVWVKGVQEDPAVPRGRSPVGMENAGNLWRLKHGFYQWVYFKGRED